MATVASALRDAVARLPGDEARAEAERLLGHALDRPRSWLYAHATDATVAISPPASTRPAPAPPG